MWTNLVAPPVGVYWNRNEMPGIVLVGEPTPDNYTIALRATLAGAKYPIPNLVREYWRKEFDRPVIKAQWEKLVEEVEAK